MTLKSGFEILFRNVKRPETRREIRKNTKAGVLWRKLNVLILLKGFMGVIFR